MNKKYLIKIILALILLAGVAILAGFYLPADFRDKKEVLFAVEKGDGLNKITYNLDKDGLIKWNSLFRAYVFLNGRSQSLQAGTYKISPSMSIAKIAGKLIEGEAEKVAITIPEGFNIKGIENKLAWNFSGSNFRINSLKVKDFKTEYDFLKDAGDEMSLEGFLFPDTYHFNYESAVDDIARVMLDNFEKKLTQELKQEISRQNKNIFDIVTMASMIENEIREAGDRELVSGILWKRLELGMPLQVDATIAYITGKNGTEIFSEDIKTDSPYNTYKYRGLPKGPISNPGIESILAAIYPEKSAYFYYLSAKDGRTVFSRTLDEHNAAKMKHLY